jgi:hypothetical protein
MSERKLLVGPDPTGSTFEKAFSKASRLPTQQDREKALELSVAEMRKELHRPEYQPGSVKDTRRPAGTNGWLMEQPLFNADTDRTNRLIEGMCNAMQPQPKPRVTIASLQGFEPSVVRAKLEEALAKGLISREQVDATMSSLKPEARLGEPKT